MAAPCRGNTGYSCYFITASTFQKQNILQTDRMAGLFVDVLLYYRQKQQYLLHEFVVMPDHFHLLITPQESLERAMQLIKGAFSFRAKRELGFRHEIWQPSFYDRRVRDAKEYFAFREYIRCLPWPLPAEAGGLEPALSAAEGACPEPSRRISPTGFEG